MTEVLTALVNTPIPTILVVAGLGFLVLSLSGKLSAHISVKEERRRIAMFCGFCLLVCGIVLQVAEPYLTNQRGEKDISASSTPEDTESGAGSSLSNPETAVWLLQFGNYSSRTNAEREKQKLEALGITRLTIVESGHYPALTAPGFYLVTYPMKQSQITSFRSEIGDVLESEGVEYFVRNGFSPN